MALSIMRQAGELITLTVQEICEACSGSLLAGSGQAPVGAVATDTRDDLAGRLFVALEGENFDGNDFLEQALAGGAMGVVAREDAARRLAAGFEEGGGEAPAVIAVAGTGEALKRIGSLAAGRTDATIVAVTGSTGKTSTKDIIASLVGGQLRTVASRGSFNNEVGVPLTLLDAGEDTEVIIVEMGMQAPGEITELCRIVAPDVAVITNIGPAHLEFAGSMENIAAGKAEIAHGLAPGGRLVVPFGEALLAPHLEGLGAEMVTFGMEPEADVHPEYHEHLEDGTMRAAISCLGETVEATFNFSADHHLLNALAALAVYRLLGLPLARAGEAAGGVSISRLRGESLRLASGAVLINDCYNANPRSMRSSLEYLASIGTGGRTVAVLGDMGELGEASLDYHREVGRAAAELAIDCLVAVGEMAQGYLEGYEGVGGREARHFADRESALAGAPSLVRPGDFVLVKASRFMRLEELSEAITAAGGGEA
ncbi:MAG: UDP-N-acetylmuramoyl-tripeptide--D-alanyl-D-alanine ligase [Gaiellales bacterium]|nr:MAG: UDP-N-acetylmuramoyl-tripeptide--D-alanyl-D-alanine ligase [Gaiellales bacterium]